MRLFALLLLLQQVQELPGLELGPCFLSFVLELIDLERGLDFIFENQLIVEVVHFVLVGAVAVLECHSEFFLEDFLGEERVQDGNITGVFGLISSVLTDDELFEILVLLLESGWSEVGLSGDD